MPPGTCTARRHYRKVVLAGMPTLKYLDDSPAFDKDRRLAVAFVRGGMEEERRWVPAWGACLGYG